MTAQLSNATEKSFSGIPPAEFIDNVEEFMKKQDANTNSEAVIKRLDLLHQKYKYMEATLAQKKFRLVGQIPDIRKSLELVDTLSDRKAKSEPMRTRFLLSDQCFARAVVPPTDKVCLWLGANVVLEYRLDEAKSLLTQNLQNAERNLYQIESDLDFLKDQLTTTEVNMARVYNWDVQKRKAASLKQS